MLLLFTLLVGVVLANDCVKQLSQTIHHPKSCGVDYFRKLECKFPLKLAQYAAFNGFNPDVPSVNTGRFCVQYEAETGVSLNLYNAFNQNLCTLKNPVANDMYTLWNLLLTKTRAERREFYVEVTAYSDFPFPIPPADNPDLDFYGIEGVFHNISNSMEDYSNYNPIPPINNLIAYAHTFPGNVPQQQLDLQAAATYAKTILALALPDVRSFFTTMVSYINLPGFSMQIFLTPLQYTLSGLAYIFFTSSNAVPQFIPLPEV